MFLFGLIDNGVLLLCMAFGIELDDYIPLPKRFRSKGAGAALGAIIGNGISDGIAALPQGLEATVGVTAGCFSVLVAMPLVLRRMAQKDLTATDEV
jgi:hypothetical protein